ncbi:MAG: hypothetical protein KAY50_00600 [Chitinophagaceae bacterium]|nr:hypothetical protein [Chitinophagaceae bacterium]
MMQWIIIQKMVAFLKGLVDPYNTYSMKRFNAMKVIDVMLILTVLDAMYNKVLRIEVLGAWITAGLTLHGITILDKRIDARKEVEMEKAKKDLDLNVKVETKETKNENQ